MEDKQDKIDGTLQPIVPQGFSEDVSKETERLIEAIVNQRVKSAEVASDGKSAEKPRNPPTNPPASNTHSQPIEPQDFTRIDEAPSPSELQSESSKYLHRIKLCLLRRIEDYLAAHPELDLLMLMPMLKSINELQLTEDWTNRLADIIERNPSNLVPPGLGKKGSLTKLQNLASTAKSKGRDDRRTGRDKLRRNLAGPEFPTD